MLKSFLIPVSFWIANKVEKNKTIIVGLAGGQGTGKTTISSIIKLILIKYFKLKVFKISIDDFYKTRKERITLSKKVHSLLLTRGVPGTHDIDLMLKFFNKIKLKKIKNYKLPKFNKAIDDRFKKDMWYNLKSKPDVIIFEGWCVGAKSQNLKKLKKPINQLEKKFDKKMKWRKYVNYQLSAKYKKLYDKLDLTLVKQKADYQRVIPWYPAFYDDHVSVSLNHFYSNQNMALVPFLYFNGMSFWRFFVILIRVLVLSFFWYTVGL